MIDQTGWKLWFGIEVEGRYVGVKTIFFRPQCLDELNKKFADKKFIEECSSYPHCYFNPEFLGNEECHVFIRKMLTLGKFVTLSVTPEIINQLPNDLLEKCHLMLVLPVSVFSKLKKSDTLRIDVGDFENFTVTKTGLLHTVPSDYDEDTKII